jgi:hypothetical protein
MHGAWLVVLAGCGRIGFEARDASSSSIDAGPVPGLIAWYPMDDPLTDGADDASGNGHTALCVTACPTSTPGHIGAAGLFGAAPTLRIPHAASLDTPSAFTVAVWIRIDTYVQFSEIFSRPYGSGVADTFQLEFPEVFVPRFQVVDSAGPVVVSAGSVTLGVWTHLAGTWDGSTATLYVGGAAVGSIPTNVLFDAHDLIIGGDQNNNGPIAGGFNGAIDDVRLYDRALSPAEITSLASS